MPAPQDGRQQRQETQAYASGQGAAVQDQNTYIEAQASATQQAGSPEEELAKFKELLAKDLISQEEYKTNKPQIMQQL